MQHFPSLSALYTPRPMSGETAAAVLTTAYASGADDDSAALADLFAGLGARIGEPQSDRAAELSAAFLGTARTAAAQLS